MSGKVEQTRLVADSADSSIMTWIVPHVSKHKLLLFHSFLHFSIISAILAKDQIDFNASHQESPRKDLNVLQALNTP